MTTTALTVAPSGAVAAWSPGQVEELKRLVMKGGTDDEVAMAVKICERTQLDPFAKQIYFVKRWDTKERREVFAPQVSIDGFRLIAQRSGDYAGQLGPFWCGADGAWKDVWLEDSPPVAAKAGVLKHGFKEPLWAVARFRSYVQTTKEGAPTKFWKDMPEVMIAKVAESLALRKAFPMELSGLYTVEEMAQADNEPKAAAEAHREPSHSRKKWVAQTLEWAASQGLTEGDVARLLSDNGLPGIWELKADQCVRLGNLMHAELERRAKPAEQEPIDVDFEDVPI